MYRWNTGVVWRAFTLCFVDPYMKFLSSELHGWPCCFSFSCSPLHLKAIHLLSHANKIHFYRFISTFSSPPADVELYLSATFYQPTHRFPSNVYTRWMDWVTSARSQHTSNSAQFTQHSSSALDLERFISIKIIYFTCVCKGFCLRCRFSFGWKFIWLEWSGSAIVIVALIYCDLYMCILRHYTHMRTGSLSLSWATFKVAQRTITPWLFYETTVAHIAVTQNQSTNWMQIRIQTKRKTQKHTYSRRNTHK